MISGPGQWANVEGDLRCPRPSGSEWGRNSRVSPSAVIVCDCVSVCLCW